MAISIKSLLTGGLSSLLGNWQKIVFVAAVVWTVHALLSTGKELGKLSEATEQNGIELKAIRGQLSDLASVSNQMLDISKSQMALTQKLDADYEQRKATNDAEAARLAAGVSNGSIRLSIKQPATHANPVPYPANAGR